jgi:hypothetical protein
MKKFVYASVMISLMVSGAMAQTEPDPTGLPPVALAATDLEVLVPQTWIIQEVIDKDSYWEPYVDFFGNGDALVISGVHAFWNTDPWDGTMNAAIAHVKTDGTIDEYAAFYTDAGDPWMDNLNESRTSGNPPRIACSKLPGVMHYMTAQETTPYWYDEFNTDGRWDSNWQWTAQTPGVQIFNMGADGPEPITNLFDPIYGVGDPTGTQASQCRFGGEIICLSNGNFVTIPEDRGEGIFAFRSPTATLFDGNTGDVLKMPFNANIDGRSSDIWSNAAAGEGFWVARLQGIMNVWDNDCNPMFSIDQDLIAPGLDRGRGDGTRIACYVGSSCLPWRQGSR